MPTLTPTKRAGARAMPNEMLYVEPECQVSEATFLADVCSGMLTHERAMCKLLKSCGERAQEQELRSDYSRIGNEVEQHIDVLEEFVRTTGGDPLYLGPMARATQAIDTHLIQSTFLTSGGVDAVCREMAMLDVVFMSVAVSHANWSMLSRLGDRMPDTVREQVQRVAEVEEMKDRHLAWARNARDRQILMRVA